MAVATVGARYAKSLLDLAKEQGIEQIMYTDMKFVKQTLAQNRQLAVVLKNPIVRAEKKNSVMKAVFASRLNPLTMAFFQIVANKNREGVIDSIAEQFVIQYEKLKGVERATIITTMPLTDTLREQFKAIVMKNTTGKSVELDEKIDPNLIGGYILRVGDQQIDGSIRSQLNDIRLQFLN